jgi:hypothetical protein
MRGRVDGSGQKGPARRLEDCQGRHRRQFRYTQPEAMTTVNAKDKPTQPGAYVDVIHGPCNLKPDVTMTMKADVAHAFWHGRVNLVAALAKKDIVATGPIPKILKLLPAVRPLYKAYPALLKEKGYGKMVLKMEGRQELRDRDWLSGDKEWFANVSCW